MNPPLVLSKLRLFTDQSFLSQAQDRKTVPVTSKSADVLTVPKPLRL